MYADFLKKKAKSDSLITYAEQIALPLKLFKNLQLIFKYLFSPMH